MLVSDSQTKSPNYPSLGAADPAAVIRYLTSRNFIEPAERVERVEALGTAARNTILRVVTGERSFVLKQFRAWTAGDRPPGPAERFRAESQFHRSARIADCARAALPGVLHQDAQAGCIIFEDAGDALPLAGRAIPPGTATKLGWFLVALHHHSRSVPACAHYRNEAVLGWRMGRLFSGLGATRPQRDDAWLARWRDRSTEVRCAIDDAIGALERAGTVLVHGDYTPANWVQNGHGPRVVDGEFSFFGPPEFDAGAFLGGLLLGRQSGETLRAAIAVIARGCFRYDIRLVAAYAGVHVCDALTQPDAVVAGGGEPLGGAAAGALLRRVQRAIAAVSLEPLVAGR